MGEMKLSSQGRQKLERQDPWQLVKHAKLYYEHLQEHLSQTEILQMVRAFIVDTYLPYEVRPCLLCIWKIRFSLGVVAYSLPLPSLGTHRCFHGPMCPRTDLDPNISLFNPNLNLSLLTLTLI